MIHCYVGTARPSQVAPIGNRLYRRLAAGWSDLLSPP